MALKLIKKERTYIKDSVQHRVTDLFIINDRGYKIAIKPKFDANKRDWRDLFDLAEEEK